MTSKQIILNIMKIEDPPQPLKRMDSRTSHSKLSLGAADGPAHVSKAAKRISITVRGS